MDANVNIEVAASPQHTAERLCLSGPHHRSCEATPRILLTAHRSLLTLFFLLLTAHCSLLTASAAWTRQPTGTMAWLRGVYFLDQNRGWVAGSGGTLLETIDGGQNWGRLHPPTKDNF